MKWSNLPARLLSGGFVTTLVLFVVLLVSILHGVFVPGQTLFSNDGPLSQLMAQCHRLPDRFLGCWLDLNNVGFNGGAASPSISFGLQWLLGPILFSKLYSSLSLLILGLGAWCFFRQSKLAGPACVLGGLAVVLNSTFFSVACWGVGAHDITAGLIFFALAALADTTSRQRWLRVILAGMAVGMAVAEGADVGAIYSLYVAAFVVYQAWTTGESRIKSLTAGVGRLTLVVLCAAFLAVQAIHGLVVTSVEGTQQGRPNAQSKADHWDWATQWSLPRSEMLNLVVPGIFGYRMDTPDGGAYWGAMGRAPAWDKYLENGSVGPKPIGFIRYSGGGNYAGVIVVLVAIWAGAQSLRRKNSIFNPAQRKWLWFWLAAAIISLLLALGRFAPFYQMVYALPYFSTVRNPTKFLYHFGFALAVLFAYGIDGLCRQYMRPAAEGVVSRWAGFGNWWSRAAKFDKYWVYGCGLFWLLSLLGWWLYAQNIGELENYLHAARVSQPVEEIANFSINQAGWFVLVFFLAAGLMTLILSGVFNGARTVTGSFLLAVLLVADLGLANQPWIKYWDYLDKYSSNPVIDRLQDKPYEHRVAVAPIESPPQLGVLPRIYKINWLQQQFPYHNIQSFETVEMPRMPDDYAAFAKEITDTNTVRPWFRLTRAWQLTSSDQVLAPSEFVDFLNLQNSITNAPFQVLASFRIEPKPGVTAVVMADQVTAALDDNGPFCLFRFTAALPRVKLFSRWEVNPNRAEVMQTLFSPEFDPAQSVFVAGGAPASPATDKTDPSPGTVDFTSYEPKHIVLQATAAAPSILLLTDHFDPSWKVYVDGQPGVLLRCNLLMQGVHLEPGAHKVEFKFQPPIGWLYVSLSALATSGLVLGLFIVSARKDWVVNVPESLPVPLMPANVPPANTKQPSNPRKPAVKKKAAKK